MPVNWVISNLAMAIIIQQDMRIRMVPHLSHWVQRFGRDEGTTKSPFHFYYRLGLGLGLG